MTRPTLLNYVTCSFGTRGSWAAGYHTGIDFRAPEGTKVFATKKGKVLHAGPGGSYGSSYGNYVVIRSWHKGKFVQHLYAHLSKTRVVPGQRVRTGETLGLSGNTGNSTAAHLHYEERVSPFGYYDHVRPVLPYWRPLSKKILDNVLKRIGVRK